MPKSSIETCTPFSRKVLRTPRICSTSLANTFSVISTSSRSGAIPVSSNMVNTSLANSGSRNCITEIFTATRSDESEQYSLSISQARRNTLLPNNGIKPYSSARGMKILGLMGRPSFCGHLARASNPLMCPSLEDTNGCKATSIS